MHRVKTYQLLLDGCPIRGLFNLAPGKASVELDQTAGRHPDVSARPGGERSRTEGSARGGRPLPLRHQQVGPSSGRGFLKTKIIYLPALALTKSEIGSGLFLNLVYIFHLACGHDNIIVLSCNS